ncbi:MAG: RNA polymerase sigma factor [Desulfobacterales bacterium]
METVMNAMARLRVYDPVKDPALKMEVLILEAIEGSREAFERLMDMFHRDIFRMVFFRIRSQMDAEDITQDVFLQAFKHIGGLKKIEHFKAWLYRIAVNKTRDYYRKKKLRSLISFFSENDETGDNSREIFESALQDPLKDTINKEFWHQFSVSLDRLSKLEKEVFLLRFIDQLGLNEIARTLSKSESTIKTSLYRALAKIRKDKDLKRFCSMES